MYLWHGSSNTNQSVIYEGEGFDHKYASVGMWGNGHYFARDLKYSGKHYAFSLNSTTKQLFLVNVI